MSIAQLKMHRNTYKNNDFMLDSMSLDDLEFHLFHKSEKPNEQSDEESSKVLMDEVLTR